MKKINRFLYLFFFIGFVLILNSCEKRKLKKAYEGCCGTEPLLITFDNSESIYVPNAFTPNRDGYNDFFFLHSSQNLTINSFIIRDHDEKIIYKIENSSLYNILGWDSTRYGNRIDSLKGLFIYEFTVTSSSGEVVSGSGSVCAYYCGDTGFPDGNIEDCYFGSQHDGQGDVDENVPTYEEDCF